jgi:hypothetical protein
MDNFSEEDRRRLMEEIKKVEINKRVVPPKFDLYVEHRYLDTSISRTKEATQAFFSAIGEGSFSMSSWSNKREIKQIANEMGLKIMRSKRTGNYVVYANKPKEETIVTFDPNMLMVEEDETRAKT